MNIQTIDTCTRKLTQAEAMLTSLLANDNHASLNSETLGNAMWLVEDLIIDVRKHLDELN